MCMYLFAHTYKISQLLLCMYVLKDTYTYKHAGSLMSRFTGIFSTAPFLQFHRNFLENRSRLFAGALRAGLHPYTTNPLGELKSDVLTRVHGIATDPANRATFQTGH